MSIEVLIPELPESVADATLLDWHKQVGDSVEKGENLVDLETDKVTLELPAPISGVIKEILIESGATVEGKILVAYIEEKAVEEDKITAKVADSEPVEKMNDSATNETKEIEKVLIPELPESVSEATLLDWQISVGDFVNKEDNLVDLETDKVTLSLPSPASGILTEIIVENGGTVESNTLVAYIAKADAPTKIEKAVNKAPEKSPANKEGTSSNTASVASPAAKKIMIETGSQLNEGTGKAGRITKQDVLQQLSGGVAPMRTEERIPMTRMRKRIAERLVDAQQQAALLTTFNEVNMKPIMDLRSKYKESFQKKHDVKLGFMSFFVKATTEALKNYPAVNASIDGEELIYHNYFDIGIAVSSPRGLVVPVLRDTDNMSFAGVESSIVGFGKKAKDGSLTMEDMTGGTFSITNGGIFGSMMSTPIVNPPQSAILGMHNIVERPVVENGEIVIRPMMYVALTYDHRIIDGRESVSFLVDIKNRLEDPSRLLLDV